MGILASLGAALTLSCVHPAHERSVEDILTINVLSETASSQEIRIEQRYLLKIEDTDNNGKPDCWTLFEDGVLRSRAWSDGGRGEPDRQEMYDDKGNVIRTRIALTEAPVPPK